MTFLAGITGPDGAALLRAMAAAAPPRFVDRRDRHVGDGIAMARHFHAVLDEDRFDTGIVGVCGGQVRVAGDVRLDDRVGLAARMGIADPARWSDAAIIAQGWARMGAGLLDHLYGEFALAVWDARDAALTLARDPLGQQPLFHARIGGRVAFASCVPALCALPGVGAVPDPAAVIDMLALIPESGSGTSFLGIERVRPGHVVRFADGRRCETRWWSPDLSPLPGSAAEHGEAVREAMDRAVAARLRGAGAVVATQLSGGFDSAVVTDSAARQHGGRLIAYTAVPGCDHGIGDAGCIPDEGELAAAVIAPFGHAGHRRIVTTGLSPLDVLDRNVAAFARPIRNLCNAPWGHAINDAAQAAGARVLLTGQLGNLSISHGGGEAIAGHLRAGRWGHAWGEAMAAWRGGRRAAGVAAQALGPLLPRSAWRLLGAVRGGTPPLATHSALADTPRVRAHVARRIAEWGIDTSGRPPVDGAAARLATMRGVDPGSFVKGWRAEWGLELRDPTADRALIELCLRIPPAQYWHGGSGRRIARGAFGGRLPAALLGEARRGYQTADWHRTLRADRARLYAEVQAITRDPLARELIDTAGLLASLVTMPDDLRAHEMRYRWRLLRGVSAGHFLRVSA